MVDSLSDKFEKEGKKGLVLIGVTDENVATVDAWYKKAQPRYPIAILEDGEFEKSLGVKFFPTGAVLDPEGKIVFAGSARETSSPLKDAMSDGLKSPLFPKGLSKVQKAMADGDLEKAWAAVVSLKGKVGNDEEQDKWMERFETAIAKQAADSLASARRADEMGLVYQAVEILGPIVDVKVPFPVTEQAADLLAEIKGRDNYADEMKAGAQFEKGLQAQAEREFTEAAKIYAKTADKYPDTRLAEAARAKAAYLIDGGWCGFDSNCGDCKQADAACDKHDEGGKVKL